jgi:hypothetical protein
MIVPDYGQLRYNVKREDDTGVSFPPSRCASFPSSRCVSDEPSLCDDAVTALNNNSSELKLCSSDPVGVTGVESGIMPSYQQQRRRGWTRARCSLAG